MCIHLLVYPHVQTCLYVPAIYPWLLLLPRLPHCPMCLCDHLTFHLCDLISLFNVIKSSHACLCALFVSLLLYICYQLAHMFAQLCVCLLSPFCVLCLHVTHVFSSCLLICLLCCSLIFFSCLFHLSACIIFLLAFVITLPPAFCSPTCYPACLSFLLLSPYLSLMELLLCPASFFTPLHHLITLLSQLLHHCISIIILFLLPVNTHLHLCKSLLLTALVHLPFMCLHLP